MSSFFSEKDSAISLLTGRVLVWEKALVNAIEPKKDCEVVGFKKKFYLWVNLFLMTSSYWFASNIGYLDSSSSAY